MNLRFIYAVVSINSSFSPFIAKWCSVVWMHHGSSIPQFKDLEVVSSTYQLLKSSYKHQCAGISGDIKFYFIQVNVWEYHWWARQQVDAYRWFFRGSRDIVVAWCWIADLTLPSFVKSHRLSEPQKSVCVGGGNGSQTGFRAVTCGFPSPRCFLLALDIPFPSASVASRCTCTPFPTSLPHTVSFPGTVCHPLFSLAPHPSVAQWNATSSKQSSLALSNFSPLLYIGPFKKCVKPVLSWIACITVGLINLTV